MDRRPGAASELVASPLPAVFDRESRVLILGTLPSPASRERGCHYGNPQNRFWRVLSALWDEEEPRDNEGRRSLLCRRHLALHDVLASARITGASDASIRDPVPNDLAPLLATTQVRAIFCTGQAAGRLYRTYPEPQVGMTCTVLPSTSPANARWRLEDLVRAYAPVREAAERGMCP